MSLGEKVIAALDCGMLTYAAIGFAGTRTFAGVCIAAGCVLVMCVLAWAAKR